MFNEPVLNLHVGTKDTKMRKKQRFVRTPAIENMAQSMTMATRKKAKLEKNFADLRPSAGMVGSGEYAP